MSSILLFQINLTRATQNLVLHTFEKRFIYGSVLLNPSWIFPFGQQLVVEVVEQAALEAIIIELEREWGLPLQVVP